MQYNIVRNCYFTSTTLSGVWNKYLSWIELESLIDGNLTSSGVSLVGSDVLCLETDLSQRIKIDGIRLYISGAATNDIKFYYKDAVEDSYILLTTQSGSEYFYTSIPSPSAPRYVRTTISGVVGEVYEFLIYNDDYVVAFGKDGQLYSELLENTPVGELGDPQTIDIYNNDASGYPATGYSTIDFTGSEMDNYIKISAGENGTYKGLEDGVFIKDNNYNSTYTWDMGTYNNTEVINDNLKLSLTTQGKKLSTLPFGSADQAFGTGANTWDWDRVNKKLYVMGLDGSALSLHEYLHNTDEWQYLTNLAPTIAPTTNFAVMCCCSGSIYTISTLSGDFGKYDISGAINNWTILDNPNWDFSLSSYDRVSMCSDGERYVYALTSRHGHYTDTSQNFRRFDTVSETWTTLSGSYNQYGYSDNDAYTNTTCMTYDYDRGRIYLINCASEYHANNHYIQLYNVSSDSWGTTWFDIETVYDTTYGIEAINYHNKWIYVSCNPEFTNYSFFRVNTDTMQVEKIYLGYEHSDQSDLEAGDAGVYVIAIDSQESVFGAKVYFAQISSDRSRLYGYSTETTYTGTYTSPILKMDNGYESSYFLSNVITTSGTTSVSYDEGSYNGTMRVRSSDVAPITINEIYWSMWISGNVYIYKYNLDTGTGGDWSGALENTYHMTTGGRADVDRRNGNVVVSYGGDDVTSHGFVIIYGRDGNKLYQRTSNYTYMLTSFLSFDKLGGVWGYGSNGYYLRHFNYKLSEIAYTQIGGAYISNLAVELDGDGIWYTNSNTNEVIHLDSNCVILKQFTLNTPRAICGTNDNGCWVIDNGDMYARRYDFDGVFVNSISLDRTATNMSHDYENGFWYNSDNRVYHVNSEGVELSATDVSSVSVIKGMPHGGCMVWSSTDFVKWIDSSGIVVRTIESPSSYSHCPGVFSYDHADSVEHQTSCLPLDTDPVWGDNGSLEWYEVRKDGYFLPKDVYHQVELTLRTSDLSTSPSVTDIVMAPVVKVEDILPADYKNIYVRTDIPSNVSVGSYESRIKTWWKVEA
jgi:hypothetical protein